MDKEIYGAMSRAFGVVVAIVGAILLYAGMFAHGFVIDQLNQEKITMPSGEAITSLKSQESQDALKPYEDQPMTTGPQAKVYADHFIWDHMMASSEGKTYQEMGDVIKQAKADALRGILLNAYGWCLVGSIAIWAGVALLALAIILLGLGFTVLRKK